MAKKKATDGNAGGRWRAPGLVDFPALRWVALKPSGGRGKRAAVKLNMRDVHRRAVHSAESADIARALGVERVLATDAALYSAFAETIARAHCLFTIRLRARLAHEAKSGAVRARQMLLEQHLGRYQQAAASETYTAEDEAALVRRVNAELAAVRRAR